MKKLIPYIIFSILLIGVANALDECQTIIESEDVPCAVFLPINVSITACNTINVSFFANSTLLASSFMIEANDFTCSGNFTQTDVGTYLISYSTGDSGSITITEGRIMEILLFFAMAIAFLMFGIALWKQDTNLGMFSGFLFMIIGIFIFRNGFATLSNIVTEGIGIITIGLGAYIAFRASVDNLNEAATGK